MNHRSRKVRTRNCPIEYHRCRQRFEREAYLGISTIQKDKKRYPRLVCTRTTKSPRGIAIHPVCTHPWCRVKREERQGTIVRTSIDAVGRTAYDIPLATAEKCECSLAIKTVGHHTSCRAYSEPMRWNCNSNPLRNGHQYRSAEGKEQVHT